MAMVVFIDTASKNSWILILLLVVGLFVCFIVVVVRVYLCFVLTKSVTAQAALQFTVYVRVMLYASFYFLLLLSLFSAIFSPPLSCFMLIFLKFGMTYGLLILVPCLLLFIGVCQY